MALALKGARDVRIMTQYPSTLWSKAWGNLHAVWSSEELKAAWFMVIHDLIPTKDRITKTQGSTTNICQHCGRVDILIHRLTECSEGADFWRWTASQNSDHPSHGLEIHSTGVDRTSEFSLLATTEAPGNFVDPRPHDILPYTTMAPSINYQLR
jgi:hypothetical protein